MKKNRNAVPVIRLPFCVIIQHSGISETSQKRYKQTTTDAMLHNTVVTTRTVKLMH